ncbi:hybrid sensor histidine kinase/response regulator [Pseudoxanthomonas mexicana]|uniref:hybrid sensor histidine kinase/response regulator n=1 Tax=Pseudoxanthomonas mexicana TaxID=128785 RepID=UPI0007839130|nr:hybrid sensor histidine kinase/response regulator [Pseudoxanthomonas mexicana]
MRAWWLLLFCLLCAPAPAAVPEIPRFRLLGAGDGLPSTTIPALARDRAGHLWVATWDGLARYDGVGFKVWRHDPADPTSLPGNVVQALHIDAADRIWVGTESGGLSMMDVDRRGFRHYRKADHPGMGSDDVFAIASRGDDVWFGTFGGGLHRLAADARITRFAAATEGTDGLPSDNVLSLAFDAKGVLWIGTMGGLARYEGGQLRRLALPGGDGLIIYSVTADANTVWVGASDGVHRWSPEGGWMSPPWSPMFARPNALIAMTSDGQGEYWLASQGGLWRTEGDHAPAPVNYDTQSVGIGRVLQTVLALPDGGLWVPVPTRGLAYLRSDWRRIAAFSSAQGLGGGLYRGLSQAGADGLWVASSTGKVERLDTRGGHVAPLPHHAALLGELRLTSVREDRRGQLWIGHRNGLIRTDPKTGALVQWGHDGDDAVPDNTSIDWLVEARDDTLWLVTQMGSVQQRDAVSGRVLRTIVKQEDGSGLPDIESLAVAPDGRVWLGGAAGMMVWDAVAGRFVAVGAMGGERVYAFAFEHADRLWLHRMSGVEAWRRADGRWSRERRIGAADGLPAVESTGLAVDPQRRVWLGTRRGLFRIDPNLSGSRALLRNFGVREGLLSQELNDRGLLMTVDGLLATTAADGSVALLDTHLPDPKPVTPNLVLDSLQVSRGDGVLPLRLDERLELQPDDHELLVGTRLLSYENPLGNRYRSLLEGFDSGWVDQGATGERVFSALTPGRYRLRVQAFDAAGNASRELVLQVHMLPPWWRSTWGLVLFAVVGVLVLLAIAAAYRRRVRRRSAWQLAEHKRELAEQASLAKTRFLATLGHEIRTPMTGVLGMTELLQATPLDERQKGYADAIQRAGTHLLRLVNDALDLAKIEAGKLELQQVEFDLQALIADVVALMGPVAGKRGLAFQDGVTAGVPHMVRGDPLRLRQILLNLLGNAIKFTETGHVSLHAMPLVPQGVRLVVGDTGPGINAEQQARLFRRFEQAEGAQTTARYGGSGLGLAICQELALAMGGRIDVDSAPGRGTRFSVDLPALHALAGDAVHAAPAPESVQPTVQIGSLEILLVEDDATVADVVTGLLRARGHRVTHAPHGLAALAEVVSTEFDVAFLDLDLPGLDGMALARQLRLQGVTTPLIALTARTDAEAEPLARQAGFDDFVRKPVTGDMLAEAIARVLGPASAQDNGNRGEDA